MKVCDLLVNDKFAQNNFGVDKWLLLEFSLCNLSLNSIFKSYLIFVFVLKLQNSKGGLIDELLRKSTRITNSFLIILRYNLAFCKYPNTYKQGCKSVLLQDGWRKIIMVRYPYEVHHEEVKVKGSIPQSEGRS